MTDIANKIESIKAIRAFCEKEFGEKCCLKASIDFIDALQKQEVQKAAELVAKTVKRFSWSKQEEVLNLAKILIEKQKGF